MKEEMNLNNYCKKGQCSRCGSCCTEMLPLTEDEVKLIRAYVKENNTEIVSPFIYNSEGELRTFSTLCPFYEPIKQKCLVYQVRPGICRTFKCDRNPELLTKQKNNAHKKAKYNHIGKGSKARLNNVYTMYELITGDKRVTLINLLAQLKRAGRLPNGLDNINIEVLKEFTEAFGREDLNSYIEEVLNDEELKRLFRR